MSETSLSPKEIITKLGVESKKASVILSQAPTCIINQVLNSISKSILKNAQFIIEENKKDLINANKRGLSAAMIDRLTLDNERIKSIAHSVNIVEDLNDPTECVLSETLRPNGLNIQKVSCPIGVLGMIYESRPNVTVDAAVLCLKSHNAVILRGGSESLHSSLALHGLIQDVLEEHGLPKACVSMVPITDRAAVGAMLQASDYIDVMIPRGGKSLIERIMNEARMPVFAHLSGLCHIFVHQSADISIARDITLNAKMRRTGVCGAMETLLLDSGLNDEHAKDILKCLLDADCNVYGDERARSLDKRIEHASADDWETEYLDSKLSCKFVDDVTSAVDHVNTYGSHHTDSIIAQDQNAVDYFLKNVDSGIVMHNASTQFADGGEFGMGAEIGIATGKMHARGPVGLEQLCTYKYLVRGNGQTRP